MSELIDYEALAYDISNASFALENIRDTIKVLPDLPRFQETMFCLAHLLQWVHEAEYDHNKAIGRTLTPTPSSFPRTQKET